MLPLHLSLLVDSSQAVRNTNPSIQINGKQIARSLTFVGSSCLEVCVQSWNSCFFEDDLVVIPKNNACVVVLEANWSQVFLRLED